jgi:hypothetical protein
MRPVAIGAEVDINRPPEQVFDYCSIPGAWSRGTCRAGSRGLRRFPDRHNALRPGLWPDSNGSPPPAVALGQERAHSATGALWPAVVRPTPLTRMTGLARR